MDIKDALTAFGSLSQETRLEAFRLLVRHGQAGMPAGALSDALGIPHNTLSFHLSHMSRAGLVTSKKEGRSVIYAADFLRMQDLIRFMVEDCCGEDYAHIRNGKARDCMLMELSGMDGSRGA